MPHQPLPVAPDVVVLGVEGEHAHREGGLAARIGQPRHDQLPVVPDLVVFWVRERDGVEPGDFGPEGGGEGGEGGGAVEPRGMGVRLWALVGVVENGKGREGGVVGWVPDGVVGGVHADDVFG